MSGPPGSGIISRQPYNGEPAWPRIGGAPKRGLETASLPSGSLNAESSGQIELMANATATFPIFIKPFASGNKILENDILCVRTDDKESAAGAMTGVYARPLRLLQTDENIYPEADDGYFDTGPNALAEAKKWRILGVVISVGHKGDNDRQLVNVAVRGRSSLPCIFTPQSLTKDGKQRNMHSGDELFVTLNVIQQIGKGTADDNDSMTTSKNFKIVVDLSAVRTVSDLPKLVVKNALGNAGTVDASGAITGNGRQTVKRVWLNLGTYIRPLSRTTTSKLAVKNYLNGENTILDRRATFEVAYRL